MSKPGVMPIGGVISGSVHITSSARLASMVRVIHTMTMDTANPRIQPGPVPDQGTGSLNRIKPAGCQPADVARVVNSLNHRDPLPSVSTRAICKDAGHPLRSIR